MSLAVCSKTFGRSTLLSHTSTPWACASVLGCYASMSMSMHADHVTTPGDGPAFPESIHVLWSELAYRHSCTRLPADVGAASRQARSATWAGCGATWWPPRAAARPATPRPARRAARCTCTTCATSSSRSACRSPRCGRRPARLCEQPCGVWRAAREPAAFHVCMRSCRRLGRADRA